MNKTRKNRVKTTLTVVLAGIIILCVGIFWAISRDKNKNNSDQTTEAYSETSEQETETQTTGTIETKVVSTNIEVITHKVEPSKTVETTKKDIVPTSSNSSYAYAYALKTPAFATIDKDNWNLLLVNRNYMLPEDFKVSLSLAVKSYSGINDKNVKSYLDSRQLDSRVAPHYTDMFYAAQQDGIILVPLSGHRRISTQKTNFENKITLYVNQGKNRTQATRLAAETILPPGCSEHNAGLAMDISSLDTSFENSKQFKWLMEHAADYGFILRYPKDKKNITEINYEPWHWRYVGVKDAKAIKASGLCLEEYLSSH